MEEYVEKISMRLKKAEAKIEEFVRWQEFSNAQYNSIIKAMANQQYIIKMILSSIDVPICHMESEDEDSEEE